MAAHSRKDSDDDDWGLKGLAHPTRRQQRYRGVIFIAVLLISLFYFLRQTHEQISDTDWSRFAYVQYATDVHSLCNAYMVFESLQRLGSKAQRVLLYPEEWNEQRWGDNDRSSQLLARAQANYEVRLKPIQLLALDGPGEPGTLENPSTWQTSTTKLRIFELEEFDRVLYFDSDVLLKHHMDELFSLPSAPVAMPRRYWADMDRWDWPLSGTLMLVEPNAAETKQLWERLQQWRLVPERANDQTYDDDLLDDRFRASALVLPHRPYVLQTAEFRQKTHDGYMGTFGQPPDQLKWDARREAENAKLIHFNDWPLPKPWRMWPIDGLVEIQPDCDGNRESSCAERQMWKGFYDEFRQRRKDMCRILSVPAPQNWKKYKEDLGIET